ncbi:hypothetical protein KK083_31960 [Fulvivirgaceae bacterium PWU4]|uniref:DUF4251 domain-containing protein n=1 Tax=Chryseosolibacter histidini TaxID=2782349 RepID=A0AAP2DUN6_9BACT|nr:hypothetical protein [Chryseosolibacter histidini]MBT1701552.1 hypothetical protein [Chryseosolibacter histidini]
MKNIFYLFFLLIPSLLVSAQDFSKNLATAKTSYGSGDLENARFAMQQAMNDIDMAIGREVLKLLPAKMDAMTSNAKNDNVTANTGLTGVLIHRDYGTGAKTCNLDIMGNSPLVASLNAILAIPFMGNSGDGTQKIIKVDGYKGILQKTVDSETNKTDYTLQIPLNSTLLTLAVPNSTEAEVTKLAGTIPVQQIAKMVQ